MSSFANWDDATLALAVDFSTEGLDPAQRADLEHRTRPDDLEAFELAVAAVHLAGMERLEAPAPEMLARLHASAREHFARRATRRSRWRHPAWGWLAAAALLVALVATWRGTSPGSPADRRAALLERVAADPLPWTSTEDTLSAAVKGDVVWSDADQEGYLRFEGLAINDPTEEQYQLWIFDATRPDSDVRPVDGGVFDVTAEGELVVPIAPALPIGEATLFAVTLEKPGGVVVSSRERLLLLARPGT